MGKVWPNLTTEDNLNVAPLNWSVSPLKSRMMKINNFHGVVKSNNTVFARLWRCEIVAGGLIKLFICKLQQIHHDLIIKKNL